MKHIVLSLLTLALVLSNAGYALADDMAERLKAAEAYEKITPVEDMVNQMYVEMKRNPQLNLTDSDLEIMRSVYDIPEMRKMVIEKMAKHFTLGELNALAAFYSSPEGKSAMAKMPAYMNDFMPYVQQKMGEAIQKVMERRGAQQKKP